MINIVELTKSNLPNPKEIIRGWAFLFLLIIFSSLIGSAAAQGTTPDITTGLVGWWKLNDGNGMLANDSSGNGNNGNLCTGINNTSTPTCPPSSGNNPTWYVGVSENALQLAGSNQTNSGIGQFVLMPDAAVLHPTQSITISLWVWPDQSAAGQEQTLFGKVGVYGLEITGTNQGANKFGVVLGTSGNTWNFTKAIGGTVNYNQWNHVAMTYTSGSVILYVNGQQVATDTSFSGNLMSSVWLPSIGAAFCSNMDGFFTGKIDDVRIYNTVLTSQQISGIISNEPHDASAPTIIMSSPSNITSTSAVINYTTNPASTTLINYGTNMDPSTFSNSTITPDGGNTVHSQSLSGLTAATTYYYTVTATSAISGLKSTSAVQNFTTGAGAFDQNLTINENQSINLSLGDPTDTTTVRTIINNPPHGTAYPINGDTNASHYTYVPRPNYYGPDSLTFQAGPNSQISTINITVVKVSQMPVFADDFPNIVFVVQPGDSGVNKTFQIPATDVNGETLTYAVTGLPVDSKNIQISSSGLVSATLSYSDVGYVSSDVNITIKNSGTPGTDLTKTVKVYVRTPKDWYLGQAVAGNGLGACSNAQSINWADSYNSQTGPAGTNWGDGSNQIGPGDTIHLCGTISTGLQIWGSGIAGYPITISFDQPGAKMSAPSWSSQNNATYGAISSYYFGPDFSYIVIDGFKNPDGTTNGIIESTDNGTATSINPNTGTLFKNQQPSVGIGSATGFTHFTVKNMTIRNMYVRAADSFDSNRNGGGISMAGSFITIQNNIVTEGDTLIALTAGDNNIIDGNTVLDFNHGITISSGGGIEGQSVGSTNPMASNLTISNNRLDGWDVWECSGCSGLGIHNDGMIFQNETAGSGGAIINLNVHGNEIGPGINPDPNSLGNGTNALFFDIYRPTELENVFIYNNLMIAKKPLGWGDGTATGVGTHVLFANNTVVGGGGIGSGGEDVHSYNNLLHQTGGAVSIGGGDNIYYDHNIYDEGVGSTGYDDFSTPGNYPVPYPGILSGFSQWQQDGFDPNSTLKQPLLDSNNVPVSDDAIARGQGMALGLSAAGDGNINWCDQNNAGPSLCSDKNGLPRPANSNWDIGAYQYNSNAYSISLSRNPETGGSITCSGGVCPSEVLAGASATFILVPRLGYLGSWTGACAGVISNACTLTINADTAVSADFIPKGNFSGPAVSIATPLNASIFLGTMPVTLTAIALPNQAPIKNVQFYIDGTVNGSGVNNYALGNPVTTPNNDGSYDLIWDTTLLNTTANSAQYPYIYDGTYILTAIVTDTNNVVGTPYSINVTISHPGTEVVTGTCGSANQTYLYGSTTYALSTLCEHGISSPNNVAFPASGKTISWSCLGANGGPDATACSASQDVAPGVAPVVAVTSPVKGSTYKSGVNINLSATATDSDGSIPNVNFYYNGNQLIGTGAPGVNNSFNLIWNNVPMGSYMITAVADNSGSKTISLPVAITVTGPVAGDVSGNGTVTMDDAAMALHDLIVGGNCTTITSAQCAAAEMDGQGNGATIDSADVINIAKKALGLN